LTIHNLFVGLRPEAANDNGREAYLDLLVFFARRNEASEQDGA
jgi:hypothetical protein